MLAREDMKPPPIVVNCEILNHNSSTVGAGGEEYNAGNNRRGTSPS